MNSGTPLSQVRLDTMLQLVPIKNPFSSQCHRVFITIGSKIGQHQFRCSCLSEKANQRIIFNGSILNVNDKKLCDIPGMGNEMTVLVTLLQPNQQGLPDRAEYLAQRQPVSQKLNLMRTLQRNFKTCVKAGQKNIDPSQRMRYEEPETPTTSDPKGTTLSDDVLRR